MEQMSEADAEKHFQGIVRGHREYQEEWSTLIGANRPGNDKHLNYE
jgi:hypothetical protein